MIVRTDVVAHLEREMRMGFLKGLEDYTPLRTLFTRETPSDGAFETYADMGAVPWPQQSGGQSPGDATDSRTDAQQVGGLHEGGPVKVVGGNERAMVVYNRDWNITIGIYHNAINDNRAGDLENWARGAGVRFEQHKDYLAFQALNGGDGTSYGLCYDGQNFFSASHADPGAEYTTAQDNEYGLTLSLDNFETVRVAGGGFLDDRGQPVGFDHSLLVHSLNLERTAAQIVSNREAYDTASREMNPYAGSITGLQAPGGYVDTTFWALIDPNQPQKPINLQIREGPQLVFWDDYTQIASGIRYYSWTGRYEIFYGDWRLAVMGNT